MLCIRTGCDGWITRWERGANGITTVFVETPDAFVDFGLNSCKSPDSSGGSQCGPNGDPCDCPECQA